MKKIFLDILGINSEYGKNKDLLLEMIKTVFNMFHIYELPNGCVLSNKDLISKDIEMNKSLMISSHLDTVHYIPPTYSEEEECIYGRGTVDDKPTFAVLSSLKTNIINAKQTVLIAFTFDEEFGMNGAKEISDFLVNIKRVPESILLAEPTELRPSINVIPLSDKNQKEFPLYNELLKMNLNNMMQFLPPSEAPIYKNIMNSNVVVCGPGKTNLCHDDYEKIYLWELEEWRSRLSYIIDNLDNL